MPEYLTPGVYIEEIERGPRPIEGVPTSTAAFLGETERGPTKPRLVTSYIDYKRWFGDVFGARDKYMPYAANGFFENGGKRLYVSRIVAEDATPATRTIGDFRISAAGPGAWGKRVWVKVEESSTKTTLPANPTTPVAVGFRLKIAYWSSTPDDFEPFDPLLPANRTKLPRPALVEDFDDLVSNAASPDFYEKRLTDNSALITFERIGGDPSSIPDADDGALLEDDGEEGGALGSDDFIGEKSGARQTLQGLSALRLDPYRDVALVHAPFCGGPQDLVSEAVITHCEDLRFRFAVIDPPPNFSDAGNLDPRTTPLRETQYAAYYYPWVRIADPQNGALKLAPPGGYALGVYARTDTERGVFKAPANETPRGVVGLEFDIDDNAQGVLNPRGVNAIRSFPGRGIKVWGARTLSANTLWKYVSVRRLFIFLERSIYEGTQWVVFEPNDYRLWARVKDTIRLFLRSQWRGGALFGEKEEEAFFITCDRTTMTQDDILNGRLICEIGIAPVRPAEFVVFRVFQHTAEAQR